MTTKGTIQICKLGLMGYTPETQVYFIQNGGGSATADFLQANRKFFDHSLFCGRIYYALAAGRIAKFRAYAEGQGFTVNDGATV